MAYSVILSDGTTDYEFVYDPASQTDYKMYYGMRVESGETRAQWHQPDDDTRQLIRLVDDPGTIFITQTVKGGAAWDNVINNIIPIKRLVNGRHQQAARYQLEGDVNKVYCRIQIDGATNYTDYEVIYGEVDDSGSYYKSVDVANTEATGVIVALNVKPYGEGAAITLRNDLAGSPHMLNSSSGLAYGLTAVGTPTVSINTVQYLIGGQSQQIITDTSTNEGVQFADVTAASSSTAVFYVWIRGTGDPVTINLADGSSVSITTATFNPNNPAGYDKTATGGGGALWYRYVVSGTNVNANFRVFVSRTAANATQTTTFRIDGAYLQTGTTTAPNAWASTSAIQNRNDPSSTSAATQARINYVDVWNIPGDSDAYLNTKITGTTIASGPFYHFYISRISDGKTLAADHTYLLDSTSLTGGSDTGTGRIGTTYKRQSISNGGTGTVSYIITDPDVALRYSRTKWRAFMVCQRDGSASNTVDYFTVQETFHDGNPKEQLKIASAWAWVDLGLLSIPKLYDEGSGGGTVSITLFTATITNNSGAARNFDCDAVFLFPVVDEFIIQRSNEYLATDVMSILPKQEATIIEDLREQEYHLGSLWNIPAGNKMTRLSFGASDLELQGGASVADQAHRFDVWNVTLVITPRTRHLLGTT